MFRQTHLKRKHGWSATFKLAHYPKFTYATRRPGLRGALPITDPELSWPVPHCVLNRRARIPAARVAAERLLRRLADARLLVIAVENGIARIEVAHEAIFRVWHLLAGWLQEEREFLIGKSRIEKARDDHTQLADIERARGLLSGILLDLIWHPTGSRQGMANGASWTLFTRRGRLHQRFRR